MIFLVQPTIQITPPAFFSQTPIAVDDELTPRVDLYDPTGDLDVLVGAVLSGHVQRFLAHDPPGTGIEEHNVGQG